MEAAHLIHRATDRMPVGIPELDEALKDGIPREALTKF